MRFALLVALGALLAGGTPAVAQITVAPVRDLAFGPVIVGVPTTIPPSHPVRSGQFQVTAPLLTRVRFRLTLPARLDGPAGASLPITFANGDAIRIGTAPNTAPTVFNPKGAEVFVVASPTIHVFIGGTVSPAGNQPQGDYTGTIILTVNVL